MILNQNKSEKTKKSKKSRDIIVNKVTHLSVNRM